MRSLEDEMTERLNQLAAEIQIDPDLPRNLLWLLGGPADGDERVAPGSLRASEIRDGDHAYKWRCGTEVVVHLLDGESFEITLEVYEYEGTNDDG
ncbi:MAG: hypothetical protein ABI647_26605 [Gemmatimonadota bacterium]